VFIQECPSVVAFPIMRHFAPGFGVACRIGTWQKMSADGGDVILVIERSNLPSDPPSEVRGFGTSHPAIPTQCEAKQQRLGAATIVPPTIPPAQARPLEECELNAKDRWIDRETWTC
jgi:hypothetical protein